VPGGPYALGNVGNRLNGFSEVPKRESLAEQGRVHGGEQLVDFRSEVHGRENAAIKVNAVGAVCRYSLALALDLFDDVLGANRAFETMLEQSLGVDQKRSR
jgi:hypothetical protein